MLEQQEKKEQPTFDDLEVKYSIILDRIQGLELIEESIRGQILMLFEATYGHQGATYQNPNTKGILQRVIQVRTNADSEQVKKSLPSEIWKKVKKESVDVPKLLMAVKMELVSPTVINTAIKTTEIDKLLWKKGK